MTRPPRTLQTIFPQKPQNLTQANHLWASAKSVGGSSPPETSVNSVNSVGGLAEGGVGMAGMPYPPNLWASVKSVGGSSPPEISVNSVNSVGGLAEGGVGMAGMPYPPNLWASVKSVGGSSPPEISVNSVNSVGGLAGGGVHSVGEHAPPGGKTQRGHGGMPCPLTLVMWMRGYGKDAIPSYDYLTSTFLTLPSAVRTMFRPFWSLLSLTPSIVKSCASPLATSALIELMPSTTGSTTLRVASQTPPP